MDATPGERIGNGRYEVRGLLGEGAQGVTYDALDTQTGRPVAIKRFDVRGAKSWKDVELAERETRVLASIDHPLVPRYIEHFEEAGALYLVMEKIEGETLDAIRKREGPLPEAEVRRFLSYADRALTYLHGRGSPVVHRDLKPRNVIRRPDGSYVLVDFGAVAELVLRKGSSTVVGTMGYMAPEQFQGRALPCTDIYAVGATALAALTGLEPETMPHQGLRVDVRTVLQGRASPAMVTALEQMLEPDPDRRAKSLAAVLEGVVAAGSVPPGAGPSWSGPPRGPMAPMAPMGLLPPMGPMHPTEVAEENARVKSIRGLLWALWGLGWIIVPLVLAPLHAKGMIPTVMFVSLAVLLVVTWHKGALIRAALRAVANRGVEHGHAHQQQTPPKISSVRHRVEVAPDPSQQVRVHTTDLHPGGELGDTEVNPSEARARAARRSR
jgi:hypothetical protein